MTRWECVVVNLTDNEMNIRYAAAYLAHFQDGWKEVYPNIDKDTAILATLYNLGKNANPPNSTPESIPFGNFAEKNYFHMRGLLCLD